MLRLLYLRRNRRHDPRVTRLLSRLRSLPAFLPVSLLASQLESRQVYRRHNLRVSHLARQVENPPRNHQHNRLLYLHRSLPVYLALNRRQRHRRHQHRSRHLFQQRSLARVLQDSQVLNQV